MFKLYNMRDAVKSLSVGYNPINKDDFFTSGDCITGQITLELSKQCKINSLCVKLKGTAEVKWTDFDGDTGHLYHSKLRYFNIKQDIFHEASIENGLHVYPFTFDIPEGDLPSSFKGKFGEIRYSLVAVLSRPESKATKAKAKFTLTHKANLNSDPMLMTPQQNTVEKELTLFTSGTVGMVVNIPRTGFYQGEGIKVVATIHNRSSRDIRPKYCLYLEHRFFVGRRMNIKTKDILKEVGDAIPPTAGQTVTRIITIPPTTCASILNCHTIKVEYRLKVYLDVKFAFDPTLKFPIVILPALQEPDDVEHEYFYPAFQGFH